MLLACSGNDIEQDIPQPKTTTEGIPFVATISVGESSTTRALTEDATNSQIVPSWAVGEKVALIHNGVIDEMTVDAVVNATASITGTITGSPVNGDAVTIIYPSSAVDATTKDIKADLLAAQDGTLATIAANYDVRKGTGKLNVGDVASLQGNVSLDNQFAIFQFTTKNADASATIDVKPLTITIGTQDYVITSASATNVLYAALPAVSSQTVSFSGTVGIIPYIYSKAGVSFDAGKYYQSTLTMQSTGVLPGKFSVSATKQVQFSQGNLQAVVGGGYAPDYYYASSWKFAEHQWDYLGYTGNNNHFGAGYSVDLFGWVGTNADNNRFGYGLCASTNDNDYGKPSNTLKSDWGTVAITNGGNTPNNGWRTLTKDEWAYLFNTRTTTSGICYAKATVNNVKGVILLPDDWSASYHALVSANTANAFFTSNDITAAEWASDFEAHGAVFLPAAGIRNGPSYNGDGYYWSSTGSSALEAYQVYFYIADLQPALNCGRHNGCSVRLVRDAE